MSISAAKGIGMGASVSSELENIFTKTKNVFLTYNGLRISGSGKVLFVCFDRQKILRYTVHGRFVQSLTPLHKCTTHHIFFVLLQFSLSHNQKVIGEIPGPGGCVECVCSPCVCVDPLWFLCLPLTLHRLTHLGEVETINWPYV